jgi:hypothetical protein
VTEIQMPPQDMSEHAVQDEWDEAAVRSAIFQQAGLRLNTWLTFILNAADEFETNANQHIAELEYEADAYVEFGPVVKGLTTALAVAFPGGGTGLKVITASIELLVKDFDSSQKSRLDGTLKGAKLKLANNVTALVQELRARATRAFPTLDDDLVESIDTALTWVDSASTNPGFIAAMCDYMGILEPSRENTIAPIRQELENEFFGVYQSVRAELLREVGVPGLDDDDLSPTIWGHEARESHDNLYRERGEKAWDDAYDY